MKFRACQGSKLWLCCLCDCYAACSCAYRDVPYHELRGHGPHDGLLNRVDRGNQVHDGHSDASRLVHSLLRSHRSNGVRNLHRNANEALSRT